MSRQGFRGAASLLDSTLLLIRLRLTRLGNQVRAASLKKKKPGDARRTGTARKRGSNAVMYVMGPMALFGTGTMAVNAVKSLHQALDRDSLWVTVEWGAAFAIGLAFLLLMAWVTSLLITIASGELVKPDWDLEWLVTLPMRSDTLLWARILERSVVAPAGVAILWPACTVIAWFSGYRGSAPLVGLLVTWPLLLLAALARTLIDTGLRLSMSASQLRNLQAVVSVLSIIVMYLTMSMSLPGKGVFMIGLASAAPEWLVWSPVGLAIRALNERSVLDAWAYGLGLWAEVGLLLWLGVVLLRYLLRHGVISGSTRDAARTAIASESPAGAPAADSRGVPGLSAVQRRELTLLSRDRNFMVQCLVLPLLLAGGQLLIGNSNVVTDMWRDANVLAFVGFGLAAYALSMSAFQTLNTEGEALWLLYTFPCSIEAVLMDKARMWGVLTLVYPLVLFGIGLFVVPQVDLKFASAVITAFIGVPIYAFIAVAIGVFGSDPLDPQPQRRIKPEYLLLYLMLAGLYIYAIATPHPFQRLVFVVLTLLLSFALWQKARDRLPYLLDGDTAPPARISVADGLIAVMTFFVFQGVVGVAAGKPTGAKLLVAFTVGGAITYALARYVYRRSKTQDVPRLLAERNRPLLALALGLAAALPAIAYVFGLQRTSWFEEAVRNVMVPDLGWWVVPLAVVAAPLFEEFIFRGLIYGGLRRSFGAWPAALASAAIFACVHPPISIAPVFLLGLATAYAYERSRGLLAPMLTHATYNTCVIGAQMLVT